MVAVTEIFRVVSAALWKPWLLKALTYQLRPKPPQRVTELPPLNEKIASTRIGA